VAVLILGANGVLTVAVASP